MNIPPEKLIERAMVTAVDFPHNVNEIEKAGLTPIPSEKVKPPRTKECKIHLECKLKWHKDNIFVGKVVVASADQYLIQGSVEERQKKLQQIFLIGAKMYGKIGEIKELPLKIIEQYKEKMNDYLTK